MGDPIQRYSRSGLLAELQNNLLFTHLRSMGTFSHVHQLLLQRFSGPSNRPGACIWGPGDAMV